MLFGVTLWVPEIGNTIDISWKYWSSWWRNSSAPGLATRHLLGLGTGALPSSRPPGFAQRPMIAWKASAVPSGGSLALPQEYFAGETSNWKADTGKAYQLMQLPDPPPHFRLQHQMTLG